MPFKTVINFDSDIFKPARRVRAIGAVPLEAARGLEKNLRQKNKTEVRSGSRNPRRGYRRSARDERFAEDSGDTMKSLKSKRTGTYSAEVGFNNETAGRLQSADRVLISDEDQREAERDFINRLETAVEDLCK